MKVTVDNDARHNRSCTAGCDILPALAGQGTSRLHSGRNLAIGFRDSPFCGHGTSIGLDITQP